MIAHHLVLLRHGKADNPPGGSDEQRPLSGRGHADALAAGGWLATRHVPDLVLCSPSKRTRQTWQAVSGRLPGSAAPEVDFEPRLYHGGAEDLLRIVQEIDERVGTALVIGHNPTLTELAFALDPGGKLDSDGLRTSGLAVHRLDGPWAACRPGGAPITAVFTARGDR